MIPKHFNAPGKYRLDPSLRRLISDTAIPFLGCDVDSFSTKMSAALFINRRHILITRILLEQTSKKVFSTLKKPDDT